MALRLVEIAVAYRFLFLGGTATSRHGNPPPAGGLVQHRLCARDSGRGRGADTAAPRRVSLSLGRLGRGCCGHERRDRRGGRAAGVRPKQRAGGAAAVFLRVPRAIASVSFPSPAVVSLGSSEGGGEGGWGVQV